MNEFVTPKMNDKVREFCHSISAESEPIYLPVTPTPGAEIRKCGVNVNKHIEMYGGSYELGWIIFHMPNLYYEAEPHAIWIDEKNCRHDITPHEETVEKILFLPDDTHVKQLFEKHGKWPPTITKPCTHSPLVKEYLDISNNAFLNYFNIGQPGCSPDEAVRATCNKAEIDRYDRLLEIFSQKAERNEPCPCQSGLKYKKCCGFVPK